MVALVPEACTGCGTCALVCPHGVLAVAAKQASIVAGERCIECGACQLNCHDGAIEVTKGTGCLLVIIKEDILRMGPPESGPGCGPASTSEAS